MPHAAGAFSCEPPGMHPPKPPSPAQPSVPRLFPAIFEAARGLAWCLLVSLLFAGHAAQAWQMKQASLMTQWAALVDTNLPLPEYPRPQLVRSNWLNLNGIWQFQPGVTNTDPVPTNQTLSSSILVP